MPSSGPLSPTTFANDGSSGGFLTWINPGNAAASDNTYATCSVTASQITNYEKATGYGFAIPGGATVNGITVDAEINAGTGFRLIDGPIKLVKAGTPVGTDHARGLVFWDTTDTYVTWGSPSDLWGTTWTATDINDAGFGAAVSANASNGFAVANIDHIRITVTYTAQIQSIARRYTQTVTRAATR